MKYLYFIKFLLYLYFNFIIIVINSNIYSNRKLRKCKKYEDSNGYWLIKNLSHFDELLLNNYSKYLYGPIENNYYAFNYSKIFIPYNCSYHRFNNNTLNQCANYLIQNNNQQYYYHHTYINNNNNKLLHLVFFGDSALRSIVCGLSRILSGNEKLGPLDNTICGGPIHGLPISIRHLNKYKEFIYYNKIKITFWYIKNILDENGFVMEQMKKIINDENNKPYAIIYNSGAWDFDKYARENELNNYKIDPYSQNCSDIRIKHIVHDRYSYDIINAMFEISKLAKEKHVRIIYRNSHYNIRYSAYCADYKLENLISIGPFAWEIWDNRNISKYIYEEQNFDGFHFDRHRVFTVKHHIHDENYYITKEGHSRGTLEMQLTQSFLQSICYDYLQNYL